MATRAIEPIKLCMPLRYLKLQKFSPFYKNKLDYYLYLLKNNSFDEHFAKKKNAFKLDEK